MNPSLIIHLICPKCKFKLEIITVEEVRDRIKTGELKCSNCFKSFPIINFIPRFVSGQNNYAVSFGYQWNKHCRTQYDKYSGAPISEERFFKETRWSRNLRGEILLEAGSGSGRLLPRGKRFNSGTVILRIDLPMFASNNRPAPAALQARLRECACRAGPT